MGTFFVTQKIWERQGKKYAMKELWKAKSMLIGNMDARPSWKEKLLGANRKNVHYKLGNRKVVMV